MKASINPAWLVSLMCRWSARLLSVETGSLGYPKKACGFNEKTTGGYNHTTPHDFSFEDYAALEKALAALREQHEGQFVTMMMYYKPWCVAAMRADGWSFGDSTYFKRLHAAHSFVATQLDDMRLKVE